MLDGEEQLERRSTKPDAKAGAPRNCYNYPRVTLLYYLLLYGSVVSGIYSAGGNSADSRLSPRVLPEAMREKEGRNWFRWEKSEPVNKNVY